jgi:hypothetical protein
LAEAARRLHNVFHFRGGVTRGDRLSPGKNDMIPSLYVLALLCAFACGLIVGKYLLARG